MRHLWFLLLLVLVPVDLWIGLRWYRRWQEDRQDPIILSAAQRYRVHPALVKAVIWRESEFNPKARGPSGEFGLMQIRMLAGREWAQAERVAGFAPEHLIDPLTNALAGSWYLGKLLKRYEHTDDPLPFALADYNAGRFHVRRWNNGAAATNSSVFVQQIDFPGTRKYIQSVLGRYRYYYSKLRFDPGAMVAPLPALESPPSKFR